VSADAPNAVRYRAILRDGHVESYEITLVDPDAERAVWIRATLFVSDREPERALAEGWAVTFDRRSGGAPRRVAVKHAVPYEGASFSDRGLSVRWKIDESAEPQDHFALTSGATSGLVTRRDHRVAWSLIFSGAAAPLMLLPGEALYRGPFPILKPCVPCPDARFEGEIVVDGERWPISGWRGMQAHRWGRGYPTRHASCRVNAWESDEDADFLLAGVSADIRLGPIPLPRATLLCVRDRGVTYDFNLPRDLVRSRADLGLRRWEFSAESDRARVEGSVEAHAADFVGLYTPSPDGQMTYGLGAALAHARVRFEADGKDPRTLTSRAATLEIGTREEAHGVRMYL
jgi:hypothetical protein